MRVLHIMSQDIYNEIPIGGSQCAKKNHQILENVFGKENTYVLMFSKYCSGNYKERVYAFPACVNPLEDILNSVRGYRRFNPKYKKEIREILNIVDPDIVFLDSSELGQIIKLLNINTKSIVHFHNIEVDYIWKNRVKRKRVSGFPALYAGFINENLSVKRCDKVICLNDRDNKRLQEVYKRKADLILPICFKDKFDISRICRNTTEQKLIFIGSLFPPNMQGIMWFVEKVISRLPNFKLTIVGRGFEEKRNELERENVKVIGTVEDLDEYYYSYSSVVMPILYGDGMKVKTAEAMMYGMNIFATTEALEGYKVNNVKGIYRCDTADEFVNAIKDAYEYKKIEKCAMEVRNCFLENNEMEVQINKFKGMIDKL